MDEFTYKQERVLSLLEKHDLDALLLRRASSFAWATCGANSAINTAETHGEASLLITKKNRYLITSATEESRLAEEEGLAAQGWEFITHPWYMPDDIERLIDGKVVGADSLYSGARNLSTEVARLRTRMSQPEQKRFKQLGRDCAAAMNEALRAVEAGMTEYEIASLLTAAVVKRGIHPVVNLVATDERFFSFRHPLPTRKKLKKFVIVVLCGRRKGLVSSITRFVHFGPIPAEIKERSHTVAEIDAAFISSTKPGRTLGEVFAIVQDVYTGKGYPDQWTILHQGGIAGYEPREFIAKPGSKEMIYTGQFFAWNPTLSGVKSEDTIFLGDDGIEIITEIEGWPFIEVPGVDGQILKRPAILQK